MQQKKIQNVEVYISYKQLRNQGFEFYNLKQLTYLNLIQ